MTQDTDIFEDLRARLISGGFEYGAKLRAEVLRRDYGCSASTVRETLFRLSTLGLVSFQEQRGFRVPTLSPRLQHDLTHMRILLEAEGACLSMRRGGIAWEARLSAVHHKLSHIERRISSSGGDPELLALWIEAEQEFHQTLISACGSQVLEQTHREIYDRFRQQLIITDRNFAFVTENIQQHQAIVDAALDGDEALVRQRIHDHLSRNMRHPEAA